MMQYPISSPPERAQQVVSDLNKRSYLIAIQVMLLTALPIFLIAREQRDMCWALGLAALVMLPVTFQISLWRYQRVFNHYETMLNQLSFVNR